LRIKRENTAAAIRLERDRICPQGSGCHKKKKGKKRETTTKTNCVWKRSGGCSDFQKTEAHGKNEKEKSAQKRKTLGALETTAPILSRGVSFHERMRRT